MPRGPDLTPFAPYAATAGVGAIMAILVVNVMNALAIIAGPREGERTWYLLTTEASPGTWLSVTMLTTAGLLSGVCAVVDAARRRPFWVLVMAALFAMSLDDAAEVHERVGGNLAAALGDESGLSYLWVVPWTAMAIIISALLWRLRPRLPSRVRFGLLLGSGLAVGAAVALEVVATRTVDRGGSDTQRLVLYSIEENLEMLGTLLVGYTLARHALAASRQRERPDDATRRRA